MSGRSSTIDEVVVARLEASIVDAVLATIVITVDYYYYYSTLLLLLRIVLLLRHAATHCYNTTVRLPEQSMQS